MKIAFILLASSCLTAQTWPKTTVEASNYERTSTVADIKSYMAELSKAAPALVPYQPANAPKTTETGKPLLAWRLPALGQNPLKVYINANIHPGEVEGKEAMLFVMRGLSARPTTPTGRMRLTPPSAHTSRTPRAASAPAKMPLA